MWPDLRLLADNIEVGVGAQEAFKLLYPGIQKKKDYSPLSDRKTVLKELLEHITCNVDVIEPRLRPMIKFCAERAQHRYRGVIPLASLETTLSLLNLQVGLCEWRKFRNNVDPKKTCRRGMVPSVAAASSTATGTSHQAKISSSLPSAKRQKRGDSGLSDTHGLVGRAVRKWFDDPGGWYSGSVTAYDDGWYVVCYEDGDSEDLDADEVRGILK